MNLFFDTDSQKIVRGLLDSSEVAPGYYAAPRHTDVEYFELRWLDRMAIRTEFKDIYSLRNIQGAAIDMRLFTETGSAVIAQNDAAWTIGSDNVARGFLALNTVGMDTYFSGAAFRQTKVAWLIVRMIVGDYNREFEYQWQIQKAAITTGTPTAVPGETFLTQNQLNALFVRFAGNPLGASIDLPSLNNGHHRVIGCNDDGTGMDEYYQI